VGPRPPTADRRLPTADCRPRILDILRTVLLVYSG